MTHSHFPPLRPGTPAPASEQARELVEAHRMAVADEALARQRRERAEAELLNYLGRAEASVDEQMGRVAQLRGEIGRLVAHDDGKA